MKKLNLLLVLALLGTLFFNSCTKDDKKENFPYDNGVFITNEGPFQSGSGTITFYDKATGLTQEKIFETVNAMPLGNIVQSMNIFNNKAYIVVNNANKVEIVNSGTFESLGSIENFNLPRYFLGISLSKAYVSCWDNTVAVVNLDDNSIVKNIQTQSGPETMIKYNDKVFVLNSGGFGVDSTITVINSETDEVLSTIQTAKVPSGIQIDKNNNMWVLCSGQGWNGFPQETDTKGHLICLNPNDYSVVKDIIFPASDKHPQKLIINKNKDILYYSYIDGVYSFDINSDNLNDSPLISHAMFYNIGFDNNDRTIYASDAKDFAQDGIVYIYNSNDGAVVDSINAGVVPGSFYFND
ncbi:MAG: hypothetical protein J7J86_06410 [Bacteroidales bacterium]|nr:hypothetical protein [Bacteroidales bacterium]